MSKKLVLGLLLISSVGIATATATATASGKPLFHRSDRVLADVFEDVNTNRDENPIPYVDAVVDNVNDKADSVSDAVNDPYLSPAIDGTAVVMEEMVDIIQNIRRKVDLEDPIDLTNVPDKVIEESIKEVEQETKKEEAIQHVQSSNTPIKAIEETVVGGAVAIPRQGGNKNDDKVVSDGSTEKENSSWIEGIMDNDYFIPITASVGGLLFLLFAVLVQKRLWGSNSSSDRRRKANRPGRIPNIGRNHSNSDSSDEHTSPQSSSSRTYDEESDISILNSPSTRDEVIEQPLSGRLVSNNRNQKHIKKDSEDTINSPSNFEKLSTDAVHNESPSRIYDLEEITQIHGNGTPKMSITDIYSPKQLISSGYNNLFTDK